jgi:hypothetical protein
VETLWLLWHAERVQWAQTHRQETEGRRQRLAEAEQDVARWRARAQETELKSRPSEREVRELRGQHPKLARAWKETARKLGAYVRADPWKNEQRSSPRHDELRSRAQKNSLSPPLG